MNEPRVVLAGCGRIGFHHLRGLLTLDPPVAIQVIEPSGTAAEAAARLASEQRKADLVAIVHDAADAWRDPDLTIVATQAQGRVDVVDALVRRGHRRFVLEKMVCQSEPAYRRLLDLIERHGARAWVNTPLRYNPLFRSIHEQFSGRVFTLSVAGSEMGLGSNAIHFLDLFQMLRGGFTLTLRRESLLPALFGSKRGDHLVEFSGTLTGTDASGCFLSVSNLSFPSPVLTITLTSERVRLFVDVPAAKAKLATATGGWQAADVDYRESYVSEVTPLVLHEILSSGTCRLPAVQESLDAHLELFRVFGEHIEAVTGERPLACPVT